MAIKKHIGKINNTGTNIVVVFREIPESPDFCLIVEPNKLPDMYHDNIMDLLDGKESQQTNNFFEVLHRRQFGDGSHMLTTLHTRGWLQKVPVDSVNMEPMPGRLVSLRIINDQIAGRVTETVADDTSSKKLTADSDTTAAKSLLAQAELLETEAKRKREEAYRLFPELRPEEVKRPGRPEATETQMAAAKLEHGEKRRAYEKKVTKDAAKAKAEAAIQDALNDKILRDAARLDSSGE